MGVRGAVVRRTCFGGWTFSQESVCRSRETVAKQKFYAPGIAPRIVLDVSMLMKRSFECRSHIVFCNSGLRWSACSYCVLQFNVALVCVFLLCFVIQGCAGLRILIVFCNSGWRWSAYSYCVLQFRVALVCVFLLCFATQGCAGLRILIVFCDSGLRWSAYSYCVLEFRVALVCVFLLCFAPQGCAGLRILIVFWNSGLRSSA